MPSSRMSSAAALTALISVKPLSIFNLPVFQFKSALVPLLPHSADWKGVSLRVDSSEGQKHFRNLRLCLMT